MIKNCLVVSIVYTLNNNMIRIEYQPLYFSLLKQQGYSTMCNENTTCSTAYHKILSMAGLFPE